MSKSIYKAALAILDGEDVADIFGRAQSKIEELEAENERLRENKRDAYFEGWCDGRNTASVDGDPTHDWNDSESLRGEQR